MRKFIVAFALLFSLTAPAEAQINCQHSPDDEMNIEYFNLQLFMDGFELIIQDLGSEYKFTLSCPERETATIPPRDFDFFVQPFGNSSEFSSCSSGSFVVTKAALSAGTIPSCSGANCKFQFIFRNSSTTYVYSTTLYQIALRNGGATIIPTLNPATLPICQSEVNNCLTSNSCSLSTQRQGVLTLCESPISCASPPNSQSSTYNSNIYFQTAISQPGGHP